MIWVQCEFCKNYLRFTIKGCCTKLKKEILAPLNLRGCGEYES